MNKQFKYLTLFLFIQYVIVTLVMMLNYDAGQYFNHAGTGFIFNQNYLSDLGRTRTFLGAENPSYIFYTLTLSLAGLGVMLFFFLINAASKSVWRFVVMTLGLVSGVCYIGIAINPVDVSLEPHLIFGRLSFFAFFFASLGSQILLNKKVHPLSNKIFTFLNILMFFYLLLMFFGPPSSTGLWAIQLKTLAQKIIVYALMICSVLILNDMGKDK